MKKRLVIIPAFNEVGSIEKTVEDIKENAPSFDYVIINDHSMDGTKELCDRLGYNMVTLSINSGIGAAVQTGYLYGHRFGYDYAIQIDGDGQHDAKFLEKMADIMEAEGINMLIGSRFLEGEGFQFYRSQTHRYSFFYLADPFIDRTDDHRSDQRHAYGG